MLPRVVDDDYAVMIVRGKTSPDSLESALLSALHKMRSLGGLQLVTLHTQLIDNERRVDAVESVVRAAYERTVGRRLRSEAILNGRIPKEPREAFKRPKLDQLKQKNNERPGQIIPDGWTEKAEVPEEVLERKA